MDKQYLPVEITYDELMEAYGDNFRDAFPFYAEDFEKAKRIIHDFCISEFSGESRRKLLEGIPDFDLAGITEILLNTQSEYLVFLRAMLELQRHVHQVLGATSCSREMSNFSALVEKYLKPGIDLKSSNEFAINTLLEVMFWSNEYDEVAREKLKICIEKAELHLIDLPSLDFEDSAVAVQELLVWLCHPSLHSSTVPVANAFSFFNSKLVELGSCVTSLQFATSWLLRQLVGYMRVTIIQYRINVALNGVPEIVKVTHSDSSEPAERFVLVSRFAAVLGFSVTDEFKNFSAELDVCNYFRYNRLGMLDIVFPKIPVGEYNWPLKLLDCNTKQDIVDNAENIENVLKTLHSQELKTRISALLEESNTTEYNELTFAAPVETNPKEVEKSTIDTPVVVEEIEKQLTELSFSIDEDSGWNLDEIP